MNKILKVVLKIIPILLIGAILITSSFIFETNKHQTYERIRLLKETQVQVIASQVDSVVKTTGQSFSYDMDNVYGLERMVESINEQSGVYCYLFDKDCNQMTGFSKQQKHITGEAIVKSLKKDELTVQFTHEYYGYITIKTESGEEFLVYWQGIPSGSRKDCEYFIILTVSERECQENEAMASCKGMIGVLSIALGISLYGNIYVKPILNEEKKK